MRVTAYTSYISGQSTAARALACPLSLVCHAAWTPTNASYSIRWTVCGEGDRFHDEIGRVPDRPAKMPMREQDPRVPVNDGRRVR